MAKKNKKGTNINEAGYSNFLTKSGYTNSVVDMSQSLGPQYDADYSDNIDIEQYFRLTLTATAFSTWYRATTDIYYKDGAKDRPPTAFVFLLEGIAPVQYYRSLPFYNANTILEPTTNSFIPIEMHKFFTFRDKITVTVDSGTASTYTYDIFIIRDKFNRGVKV